MLALDRERLFALGGLGALIMICALAVVVTLDLRSDAASNLAERHDQLDRLEARMRSVADRRKQAEILAAPVQAFVDAPTSGLAAAQLQAYLSRIVSDQRAVLISSGVPPADRNDKSDAIRLQITLNATLPALQALLYRLESGVPYVFVDTLSLQPTVSGERAAPDPVLKVNMNLHAFWHHAAT